MKEFLAGSLAETQKLAQYLATLLEPGDNICLDGDLGAGKTTFTKALAVALGIPANEVTSPTFTIVQEYNTQHFIVQHFDLYRLDSPAQLDAIGYLEMLDNGCVNIIEWSELFPEYLPADYVDVDIKYINENMRLYRIFGVGTRSQALVKELENVDFSD